jgi:hypothetical protein
MDNNIFLSFQKECQSYFSFTRRITPGNNLPASMFGTIVSESMSEASNVFHCIFLSFQKECQAFEWTKTSPPDKQTRHVCVSNVLTIPWGFVLNNNEEASEMIWNFEDKNGRMEMIAMSVQGTFIAIGKFRQAILANLAFENSLNCYHFLRKEFLSP